jgi:hypothetical protein
MLIIFETLLRFTLQTQLHISQKNGAVPPSGAPFPFRWFVSGRWTRLARLDKFADVQKTRIAPVAQLSRTLYCTNSAKG